MDAFLTDSRCGREHAVAVAPDDTATRLQGVAHSTFGYPEGVLPEDLALTVDGQRIDPGEALSSAAGVRAGCIIAVDVSSDRFAAGLLADDLRLDGIPECVRNHRACVLAAVTRRGTCLRHAPPALCDDKEIVRAAVASAPWVLRYASDALRGDRGFVLALLREVPPLVCMPDTDDRRADGEHVGPALSLQDADEALRSDGELVLAALRLSLDAIFFAAFALRRDREFALAAVRVRGAALQAMGSLMTDREVVLAAVQNDGLALQHADVLLRADREVVGAAVRQNGCGLVGATPALRGDRELALAAVRQSGRALQFCSAELRTDREVVLAAVYQDAWALRCITGPMRSDAEVRHAARNVSDPKLSFLLQRDSMLPWKRRS